MKKPYQTPSYKIIETSKTKLLSGSNELYQQEMIDDEPYVPSSNNASSIWGN